MSRAMRAFSRSLPMLLLRSHQAVMAQFRPVLRAHGITEQQWRVLRALSSVDEARITRLAELTLPGETNPSPYLKQLRISITDRIQDAGALGSDIDQGKRREYYLVVAKHDEDQGEVQP